MTPEERADDILTLATWPPHEAKGRILAHLAVAVAEEREAVAKLGDERAAEHKRRRLAYPDEESWWRARMCEARDYAASIRARP